MWCDIAFLTCLGPLGRHNTDNIISIFESGKEIKVESKNIDTGVVEYKTVTNAALTSKNAQLMLIEDEETGKRIKCTPEHKIYTKNRGYVMAKDLREDDEIDIR